MMTRDASNLPPPEKVLDFLPASRRCSDGMLLTFFSASAIDSADVPTCLTVHPHDVGSAKGLGED